MEAILLLNAGSSSLKFALFDSGALPLWRGEIETIGEAARLRAEPFDGAGEGVERRLHAPDHPAAIEALLGLLQTGLPDLSLLAVGHRVVHGGEALVAPVRVDEPVLTQLRALIPLAPLHQPPALAGIEAMRRDAPDLPQVACFDTAFHAGRSPLERRFALPDEPALTAVRAYGFHGLSYEYIASRLPQLLGSAAGRVVVAHLGHGASLCALRDGVSQATTMSFTPLDGLPMATRCGQLDPAVVLYLQREQGMTPDQVDALLNQRAGLLGLSGISGDLRRLEASDQPCARFALDYFVHHTVKAIGALAATLGGMDALVFTAGIGENSAAIRERIMAGCAWLGLCSDPAANRRGDPCISASGSNPSAWVIPTDEAAVIARHTLRLLDL